jgi:hypothetical protein
MRRVATEESGRPTEWQRRVAEESGNGGEWATCNGGVNPSFHDEYGQGWRVATEESGRPATEG